MASSDSLILGTRGSDLALTQANLTQRALEACGLKRRIEQKIIATTGDKRQDLKLAVPGVDKAVFTKELEDALEAGTIHAAVHSLKDVPAVLESKFALVAVLPRAPVEDVLIAKSPDHAKNGLDSLPKGATVATSSVRRQFQLRRLRSDLNVVEIRGNVPTRLRKVAKMPEMDATILARAGLERLGYDLTGQNLEFEGQNMGLAILPPNVMVPAAGQGAIALEVLANDHETPQILEIINHEPTWQRIRAERAFLQALDAGCQTPVGIHTQLVGENRLHARAILFREDADSPLEAEISADAGAPEQFAAQLIRELGVDT